MPIPASEIAVRRQYSRRIRLQGKSNPRQSLKSNPKLNRHVNPVPHALMTGLHVADPLSLMVASVLYVAARQGQAGLGRESAGKTTKAAAGETTAEIAVQVSTTITGELKTALAEMTTGLRAALTASAADQRRAMLPQPGVLTAAEMLVIVKTTAVILEAVTLIAAMTGQHALRHARILLPNLLQPSLPPLVMTAYPDCPSAWLNWACAHAVKPMNS